jgi:sulfite reductase (ferredoxin)
MAQRTAFRELVERFRPGIRITAQQNLLFTDLAADQREQVDRLLRRYNVPLAGEISNALRFSMACPAMPTCGLALAESERALPGLVRQIEGVIAEVGLGDERLSMRMTGCPNGCARPYLGDIGFVGRTPGKYQIYLGGDFEGTHLGRLFMDLAPIAQIPHLLRPIFVAFRDERRPNEAFGDYCYRVGMERLREVSTAGASATAAAR